ncbi:MAG: hypothetical protein NTY35_17035 [Planctomycetota bacterium]|nr:hypothetical protein [Planctomycetota bacterium]
MDHEPGSTATLRDLWTVCLAPPLLAGLAMGAWFAWRWWTAPAPFACPTLF